MREKRKVNMDEIKIVEIMKEKVTAQAMRERREKKNVERDGREIIVKIKEKWEETSYRAMREKTPWKWDRKMSEEKRDKIIKKNER